MRINRSKEVFALVKSLSQTEKAYLKKWTLGTATSKLAKGFDIINSFDEFDETAISKKLKNGGLDPNDVYKRLLPILLKSLSQYHSGSSSRIKVLESIITSQVLLDKRLYTLALAQVEKGLELSEREEFFSLWQDLLKQKQSVLRLYDQPSVEEDLQNYEEALAVLKRQEMEIQLDYLYKRLLGYMRAENVSKDDIQRVTSEILEHPAVLDDVSAYPNNFIFRGRMLAAALYFVGRWEEAYENCVQLIAYQSKLKLDAENAHIESLSLKVNALELTSAIGSRRCYTESRDVVEAEREYISTMPERSQLVIEEVLVSTKQADALMSGMIERSIDIGNDFLSKKNTTPIRPLMRKIMKHQIAMAYFYQGEHTKVIRYLNTEFISDDYNFLNEHVRWIELISAFHGSDPSLFDAKWLSMKRRLAKLDLGYEWETLVLKGLKTASGKPFQEQRALMAQMHEALLTFKNEIRVRTSGVFDLITWAESFAAGRPMIDLIKERYMK